MLRSETGAPTTVRPASLVAGELRVPGDKSIAHRALMLAAIADGESTIGGLPESEDVRATIACLRNLGVRVTPQVSSSPAGGRSYRVFPSPARGGGAGWGFATPHGALDCANSGTSMRLLLGLLAGTRVSATLDGDASLRRRPMARVIDPLRRMGARIDSTDGRAPLRLEGTRLQGRHHVLPIASAQVKSAILLAGLAASGPTTVVEPIATRDHTERLLRVMGADLRQNGTTIELRPSHRSLQPLHTTLPGDFSSAAFWMAAAAVRPDWSVTIRGVGLNPSRLAFADLLARMGAEIQFDVTDDKPEPRGSLRAVGRGLKGISLEAADVAAAIDEIPALLVLASQAEGVTTVSGAAELRLKESDRLAAMTAGLRAMGADVEEHADGIAVSGPVQLRGAQIDSRGDHRIAMAFAIAGLIADGPTSIQGSDAVAVSYPAFFRDLQEISDAA
ncbi:MAG TPA: 3-phosphoshikimate 1-carboxyvinyltransferase [Candidatus Dormibacteraeota bacterium]